MQREIRNKVQLGENLNLLKDISKVPSTDNTADLKEVFGKVDKLTTLQGEGKADISLIRYIPRQVYASPNYTDEKRLEFTIQLASNTYTNYSSILIILLIQIKKGTDKIQDVDNTITVVNNFFAHWLKEVDIKHYPDNMRILPTSNTADIYNYSSKILKKLSAKAVGTIKEILLYEKTPFVIPNNADRR